MLLLIHPYLKHALKFHIPQALSGQSQQEASLSSRKTSQISQGENVRESAFCPSQSLRLPWNSSRYDLFRSLQKKTKLYNAHRSQCRLEAGQTVVFLHFCPEASKLTFSWIFNKLLKRFLFLPVLLDNKHTHKFKFYKMNECIPQNKGTWRGQGNFVEGMPISLPRF